MKLTYVFNHPDPQAVVVDVTKGDATKRVVLDGATVLGKSVPHVAELLVRELSKAADAIDPEPKPKPTVAKAKAEATP